jgi:hypothetical protein
MSKQSKGATALNEWLVANKVSITRLCADLGIHALTPVGWRRGKKPSLTLAVKIEKYTCGCVPCSSWIDVEVQP